LKHAAFAVLEPRQGVLDREAPRVLGRDVRIVRGLVAKALDEDEGPRLRRVTVHVERQHAGLGARGRHEVPQRLLDGLDLCLAGERETAAWAPRTGTIPVGGAQTWIAADASQPPRSSSATHSMCGVWGNMSTGRTRLSA